MLTDADPWLTVITVVKDAPEDLTLTAQSVGGQDVDGVEYLIIDGSADRETSRAALVGIPHRYLWTEPRGIYAAMNVGLHEAVGDFVYYANAGDVLHDAHVLARVRAVLARARPVWAFGEVEIVKQDGSRVVTPRWDYGREKAASFSRGHFPPHQGTFAGREPLIATGGFDESYAIVADYAAFLRLSLIADPLHLDHLIATFAEGGVSTVRWRTSLREFHRARREILRPRGWTAVREVVETGRQAAAMTLYRDVWTRVRRP